MEFSVLKEYYSQVIVVVVVDHVDVNELIIIDFDVDVQFAQRVLQSGHKLLSLTARGWGVLDN